MNDGLFWRLGPDGDFAERGTRVKVTGGNVQATRRSVVPALLPPVPESTWTPPQDFPSLRGAKFLSVDIETHDPQLKEKGPGVRRDGYIVGVSLATEDGHKAYYPIAHEGGGNLDKERVLAYLREELRREGQVKVLANALYDLDYLEEAGVRVAGPFFDVQVAEPLLDENSRSYSLETLGQKYLGRGKVFSEMERWSQQAFGKGDPRANIWRTPATLVGPYAEGDADLTQLVLQQQIPLLREQGLLEIFDLETRLIPMLLAMRRRGVRIDVPATERMRDQLAAEEKECASELHRLTGYQPDIWEAESMAILFDKAGVEYPRTAKTKQPSFRKGWLELQKHPVAQLLLKARHANKLRTTFLEGHILSNLIGDRVHCLFHQLKSDENGTVSGRLSSSLPNLQNIPVRSELGKLIRRLFLPERGEQWWSRDWSQVEYRLVVHFAALLHCDGVEDALDAYRNDRNTDFHQMVAAMTGLKRPDAKNFNFGMVYGQGIRKIAATLGCTFEEAMALSETYHAKAPYIRQLSRRVQDVANSRGHLKTLLGRHRHYNLWEDEDAVRDERGRRVSPLYHEPAPGRVRAKTHAALNGLIQGSAADLMKKVMVDIWESGLCSVLGVPMLTVHDELDGSLPATAAGNEALQELHHMMEHCVSLQVPLLADGGAGDNWGEAK